MRTEQTDTLRALDAVLDSSKKARETLRQAEASYRRFRRRIEKDEGIGQAFSALDIPHRRRELAQCLDELEQKRLEARQAVIAQGIDEGLSLSELARLWGFSRQLVTRIAKRGK